MTHPRDYQPILDRIGVALEATCDALMTLQSIDALADVADDGHVAHAVEHLRGAIDELRDAQAQDQTGLALGFVLPQEDRSSIRNGQPRQSSPRRTA